MFLDEMALLCSKGMLVSFNIGDHLLDLGTVCIVRRFVYNVGIGTITIVKLPES